MQECRHIVTQGKKGMKGSWCVDCGIKVYELEDRECKDCKHYFKNITGAGCVKHLMRVVPDMHVTYKIKEGTCFIKRELLEVDKERSE